MPNNKFNVLLRALQNPKSEIYLSKDWKTIRRYFWKKNITLKKKTF